MRTTYEIKNFDHLLGLKGFGDELMENHFTLYQGYVKNTNALTERLQAMIKEGKDGTPECAELRRRFGWEFNGMRMHEYFFGGLTKLPQSPEWNTPFFENLLETFGSFEHWENDFKAIGGMRGIGWVVLCYDTITGQLMNTWINEHDTGYLSGTIPLLVMDVFEHAYIRDYGLKRADYIEAFCKAIDWSFVCKRFDAARLQKAVTTTAKA